MKLPNNITPISQETFRKMVQNASNDDNIDGLDIITIMKGNDIIHILKVIPKTKEEGHNNES